MTVLPEVSRFIGLVMYANRPRSQTAAEGKPPDVDSLLAEYDQWQAQQRQLGLVAEQARSLADVPQWVYDLADELRVERPKS